MVSGESPERVAFHADETPASAPTSSWGDKGIPSPESGTDDSTGEGEGIKQPAPQDEAPLEDPYFQAEPLPGTIKGLRYSEAVQRHRLMCEQIVKRKMLPTVRRALLVAWLERSKE